MINFIAQKLIQNPHFDTTACKFVICHPVYSFYTRFTKLGKTEHFSAVSLPNRKRRAILSSARYRINNSITTTGEIGIFGFFVFTPFLYLISPNFCPFQCACVCVCVCVCVRVCVRVCVCVCVWGGGSKSLFRCNSFEGGG